MLHKGVSVQNQGDFGWCDDRVPGDDRFVRALERARGEFLEMPDLLLTRGQAQRLWACDGPLCDAVLAALVEVGFLVRTANGSFLRA